MTQAESHQRQRIAADQVRRAALRAGAGDILDRYLGLEPRRAVVVTESGATRT